MLLVVVVVAPLPVVVVATTCIHTHTNTLCGCAHTNCAAVRFIALGVSNDGTPHCRLIRRHSNRR